MPHPSPAARAKPKPGDDRPAWVAPAVLAAACLACLLPFVNKPFHIDDPLFVWAAEQIQKDPANFYGFDVNWYMFPMPMAEVTKNPPLTCYYLALVATVFRTWDVTVLHLACLVWPLAALWGTYRLAERFCGRPLFAALAALFTPAFVVSSTTVMCDTMALCFWVWAIVLWERGLRTDRLWPLCLSGLLVGLCTLTKYIGISLIPLLLVYSLAEKRRAGRWLLGLLVPLVMVAAYDAQTYRLYGKHLLLEATLYPGQLHTRPPPGRNAPPPVERPTPGALVGLSFLGGCVISGLFCLPLLWSWRGLLAGVVATALLIGLLALRVERPFGTVVQVGILSAAGVALLLLAAADLWVRRDAVALLLFLWVAGIYVFVEGVNWTINGRSLLPLVPAAGILMARRIDRRRGPPDEADAFRLRWALIPAAVVSFLVARADFWQAESARQAAASLYKAAARSGKEVWFQGHWGFQYYMEKLGARPVDHSALKSFVENKDIPLIKRGIVLVTPTKNSNLFVPNEYPREGWALEPVVSLEADACTWLTVLDQELGAGFYSAHGFGSLPFAFGKVPPEQFGVYRWVRPYPPLIPPWLVAEYQASQ